MVPKHGVPSLALPASDRAARPRAHRATSGLPDVFVVGAAKSGTSALYTYFKVHPQTFVPGALKETNYMAFGRGLPPLRGPGDLDHVGRSITSSADYQRLYRRRLDEVAAVDVSPAYLYYPHASARIAELVPDARIVIVLRNPVDCVLSMYSMMRRDGREPCRLLLEAFERSEERMAQGWEWAWDYRNCFKFSAQVARYLNGFRRSQLFIRRYEELQNHPARFYAEMTAFLGISEIDVARSNRRINAAPRRMDMIRRRRAGRLLIRAGRIVRPVVPAGLAAAVRKPLEAPAFKLHPDERRVLVDHFRCDLVELSRILAWDLSDWLRE